MRKEKRLYARPNMPLLFWHWFSFLCFLFLSAGHLRYTCFYITYLSFSLFLLSVEIICCSRLDRDYIAVQTTRNNHATHVQIHTYPLTSNMNIFIVNKKYLNFSPEHSFIKCCIRNSSIRLNFLTFFNFEKGKK